MSTPTMPAPPALPPQPPPLRQRMSGRRHRGLYWGGVLASLAALVGGGVIALNAYLNVAAPESTATAYFHALARGDAAEALALGAVPPGSREYLTSDVLRAALRVARISDVRVLSVSRLDADHERVALQYELNFAGGQQPVTDEVTVVRHGRGWRLQAAAVAVRLTVDSSAGRMSIAGAKVPSSPVLFFPGALPVSVDAPALDLGRQVVHLEGPYQLTLHPQVSDTGQRQVADAVATAVRQCLAGTSPGPCPPPADSRVVPGSVHGTVNTEGVSDDLTVVVDRDAAGQLDIGGTVAVTGTYTALDFDNLAVSKSGTVQLSIDARCYATDPTKISWGTS